jgi:hypothetical protein
MIIFLLLACYAGALHAQITRIPYRIGDKWGLCDTNLNIVVPVEYDSVSLKVLEPDENAIVRKGNKYGVATGNSRGRISLPFDSIKYLNNSKSLIGNEAGFWALLDNKGEPLTAFKYDQIFYHKAEYTINGNSVPYFITYLHNRQGIIDTNGNEIAAPEYLVVNVVDSFLLGIKFADSIKKFSYEVNWEWNAFGYNLLQNLRGDTLLDTIYFPNRVYGGKALCFFANATGIIWKLLNTHGRMIPDTFEMQYKSNVNNWLVQHYFTNDPKTKKIPSVVIKKYIDPYQDSGYYFHVHAYPMGSGFYLVDRNGFHQMVDSTGNCIMKLIVLMIILVYIKEYLLT